ncbi:MarR family winged helix-turn-helix transcriptional regulator [Arthrobacter sp.]|uniref:MarR family winged helix-turn-helix transcriptional regulator n=1 Tax=Arthrobacter sp. TaxID=1667 RepID=UPI003A8E40AC
MDTEKRPESAHATEYLQLAAAIVDISEHIRRASHERTGYGPLPNGMLDILRAIEAHPGITVAELAARLDRQFSNVSTQLKDLVARGLVTRNRDASDRRYVSLTATAEAQRIKTLFEGAWAGEIAGAAAHLTPAEREHLRRSAGILDRLSAQMTAP